MDKGGLGKTYEDGEIIIRQGEIGDCMFVIQSGEVEIVRDNNGTEVSLAIRKEGDFIGEMALFSKEKRSATVRAIGQAKLLTVDKRNLLSNIQKDPSLAFRIIESLSRRLSDLSEKFAQKK